MRHIKYVILFILSWAIYADNQEDQTIQVEIYGDTPIKNEYFFAKIPGIENQDPKASFILLKGNAIKKKTTDGVDLSIQWHAIHQEDQMMEISKPLKSYILVYDDDELHSGESFTAKGDVNNLLLEIGSMLSGEKSTLDQKTTGNQEISKQNENYKKNKNNAILSNQGTRSAFQNNDEKSDEEKEKSLLDLKVHESKEGCAPRFDFDSAQKYPRQRSVKKTAKGKVLGKEECIDTGEVTALEVEQVECDRVRVDVPAIQLYYRRHVYGEGDEILHTGECIEIDEPIEIQQDYNAGCSDHSDIINKKVYKRYTEFFMKDSERTELEQCVQGPKSMAITLTSTTEGCDVRHDFDK